MKNLLKNLLKSLLGLFLLILEAGVLAAPIITVALLCKLWWPAVFFEIIFVPAAYLIIAYGSKYEWKLFNYPINLMMGDED